jgi:hypothetical protein
MLKELNKLVLLARRRAAAWRRWHAKLPHNRVRRPRLRDGDGRPIGFGPPVPAPEPQLIAGFSEAVRLPSGRLAVVVSDGGVEAAYRSARCPRPTAGEVEQLPIREEGVRKRYQQYCCS